MLLGMLFDCTIERIGPISYIGGLLSLLISLAPALVPLLTLGWWSDSGAGPVMAGHERRTSSAPRAEQLTSALS